MPNNLKPKRGVPQTRVGNLAELIPPPGGALEQPATDADAETLWEELSGRAKTAGAPAPRLSDRYVSIDHIEVNPYQPRLFIPKARIEKRKNSMDRQGQLQSALARPHPTKKGWFQLADGNIRLLAVEAGANAGLKEDNPQTYIGKLRLDILALEDDEMLDAAWDANEERDDFSVFDRANYFVKVRELESKLAGRSPLVANAQGAPNKGAAQTGDGLLSWEELFSIRAQKDKPLPPPRTMRRAVSILGLPDKLIERLSAVNFAQADDPDEKFKGITEKHARAVLSLPEQLQRLTLVQQVEREKITGNEAEKRALATTQRHQKEQRAREKSAVEDTAEMEAAERLRQVLTEAKAKFLEEEKARHAALLSGSSPNATQTDATQTNITQTAPVHIEAVGIASKAAKPKTVWASDIAEETEAFLERLSEFETSLAQTAPDMFFVKRIRRALFEISQKTRAFHAALDDEEVPFICNL